MERKHYSITKTVESQRSYLVNSLKRIDSKTLKIRSFRLIFSRISLNRGTHGIISK